MIWLDILRDAIRGELLPVYGNEQRWTPQIDAPVLIPPSQRDLRRYVVTMLGIYPARGCPFTCNFCSVIKIAGRQIRSQSIEVTDDSTPADGVFKVIPSGGETNSVSFSVNFGMLRVLSPDDFVSTIQQS